METMNPTQHCDHCGIGPFFLVTGREYPTLCLDCADLASADGLLTFVDGKGTVWFPSSATNAAIRADEARAWPAEALADPPAFPFKMDRHSYESPKMAAWRERNLATR